MSKTIIRNTETHASVKVISTSETINLADIAYNGVVPQKADIKSVFYASDWNEGLEITRDSVNILDFIGSGFIDFMEKFGSPLQEKSSHPTVVDTSGSATHFMCIIEFIKHN